MVLWTVTFQEVHRVVDEVLLAVNGGSLKVSSVLSRNCVPETALESGLCEKAVS